MPDIEKPEVWATMPWSERIRLIFGECEMSRAVADLETRAGVTEEDQPRPTWGEEESYYAEGFHAAMRKALDNDASVVIWHTIRLLDPATWHGLIEGIVSGSGSLKERAMKVAETWHGGSITRLLRFGLSKLTDQEWAAVASFIEFEE